MGYIQLLAIYTPAGSAFAGCLTTQTSSIWGGYHGTSAKP